MSAKELLRFVELEIDTLFAGKKEVAPLNEENSLKAEQGKVLELFKLQMSENWGKLDTVERAELDRIVRTATAGKDSVQDRLKIIEQQMTKLREGTLGKIKNPRRILSQIILLETFNRLFKSFQASPAGFVNEGLISAFYRSTQEEAGLANKELQIGDVIDVDGTPISIKTKIDGGAAVDGSIKNLYASLNNSPTKRVYFDIFIKKPEGSSGQVGSLAFYRFTVDATNINEFLNKDLFDPDPEDPAKVVLKPQYRKTFLATNAVQEGRGDKLTGTEVLDVISQVAQTGEILDIDEEGEWLRNLFDVDDLGPLLGKVVGANAKTNPRARAKEMPPEEGERFLKLVGQMGKLYNAKFRKRNRTGHDPKTEKIHTDFGLTQSEWMKFALAEGNLEPPIVLNFSDADIAKTIEVAVGQIDEAIIDMFNSLATFTQTVQTYLTTIASNRAAVGIAATERANELPDKTAKVVSLAGTDPNNKTDREK